MVYEAYEQIRNATGLKNADVAKLAQVPPSTFTDWKNGKSKPKSEKLTKILSALIDKGVDIAKKKSVIEGKDYSVEEIMFGASYGYLDMMYGYEEAVLIYDLLDRAKKGSSAFPSPNAKNVQHNNELNISPVLDEETMEKLSALDEEQLDLIVSVINKMYASKKK